MSFSIHGLLARYRSGEVTPKEIIARCLERAGAADPKIWITLLEADQIAPYLERLEGQSPDSLPLYGVPFAIKDNIDLAQVLTTAGCPAFAYTADRSAFVVQRLLDAGAIPIGKTNLDQFATGLVGVRSPYGFPANAFLEDYIPGGSSSGSAIAVARDLVCFSLGTDTAGSGRVPASLNNLVGLKPTRGLLGTTGVVPACRTLDSVSIFTQNAADAGAVLDVCAQLDPGDPFARPAARDVSDFMPTEFRFGVPEEEDLEFFGNSEAASLFNSARVRLRELGGEEVRIAFGPFLEAARLLYEGPWVAERYLAARELLENDPDSLHPITRSIVSGGGEPKAIDAFAAAYRLAACKQRADEVMATVDFVLTPTNGTIYTAAEVEADPLQLNSNLGYYTNFMNLLDFSAVALPAGFYRNGHPFGVTIFGAAFTDRLLLDAAARALDEPVNNSAPNSILLAVCGAHLEGLPLHHQLQDLGAKFARKDRTSRDYRFYSLANTTPPKPGLQRVNSGGESIEIEIYSLDRAAFGAFVAAIPAPLGIGKIETASGEWVSGFLCENHALDGAEDITIHGGWRAFLAG